MQLKFRQPILDKNGNFIEFQIWGVGLTGEAGENTHIGWVVSRIVNPIISQQYTGIFDRNGKEYCIGDIVLDELASIGVLVWFYDRLGIASGEIGNYHAIDAVRDYDLAKCKIVGNIYENPNYGNLKID